LYVAIKTIYNGIIHESDPHNMNLVIIMMNRIIAKYELINKKILRKSKVVGIKVPYYAYVLLIANFLSVLD